METFNQEYYRTNGQDKDRPALWMYFRFWRRYCSRGPVLEFGCGVGHLTRRISRFAKVYALEVNHYARERLAKNASNAILIEQLEHLPDHSVESIVSLHVLEHIVDSELSDIGKQFRRILKPGGRLMLVMPDLTGRAQRMKDDKWLAFSDSTHVNLKGSHEWGQLFVNRWGLKLLKCGADGYYDFPYGDSFISRSIGDISRAFRTLCQFVLGRILLKPGDGEAVVFILEKSNGSDNEPLAG